jgi:hypothetical protein
MILEIKINGNPIYTGYSHIGGLSEADNMRDAIKLLEQKLQLITDQLADPDGINRYDLRR